MTRFWERNCIIFYVSNEDIHVLMDSIEFFFLPLIFRYFLR